MENSTSEIIYTFLTNVEDKKMTIKGFESGNRQIIIATIVPEIVASKAKWNDLPVTFKIGHAYTETELTTFATANSLLLEKFEKDDHTVVYDPAISGS
ncbi:MAG TPA: hypothetical protein PKY56_02970 [Candidatus Kapabacteria bacterium]|nr:hypothetical protein [Candidatus Kapabacteria bacterium]